MAKNVELLLLKTVENLGIVGDVVKVKSGYARNYLLPHGYGEAPTAAKIESLKEERARAQAELAALREQRQKLVGDLVDVTLTMERSCNDQGALYGSVTHRDISDALIEAGHGVSVESIRLSAPIRRVGSYPVPIQFDKDLGNEITLIVKPDREIEGLTDEGETEPEAEGAATDTKSATDEKKRPAEKKHRRSGP